MPTSSARKIDLNADLGEHDGDGYDADTAILEIVTSASIACGAHGGSREVMKRTIELAAERGVSIGAHPGYADRAGFGRREAGLSPREIIPGVAEQIEMLAEFCAGAGVKLRYVKPHGALYNRAAKDPELSAALAECVHGVNSDLAVLMLPETAMWNEAKAAGLRSVAEAFIDRAYMADGTLVPRVQPGAVIDNPAAASRRALQMVLAQTVHALDGTVINVAAESLCVHGDSRNALETVRLARETLESAGVRITPFCQ